MTDFPPVVDADFKPPDHTASASVTDRIKEGVTGRSRLLGKSRSSTAEPKPRKVRTIEPDSRPGEFVEPIADFYRLVGATLFPFDPACASVLFEVDENKESKNYGKDRAQLCAESLDAAAQKSPGLRKTLRMLTTGGVWGAVIAAHAPIAIAALQHHTPLMERTQAFIATRMSPRGQQSEYEETRANA